MADFKSRRPPRVSISPDAFNSGNALSFKNQPSLGMLFRTLSNPEQDVTFILGAGISVDAGFPVWEALVDRLSNEIKGRSLRRLAKLDTDGPMRRAESIFRMISADNPDLDAGVLRAALYHRMPKTEPGPIAVSIARIWASRRSRIRILTTNFDDVMEEALEAEFGRSNGSFSLYQEGQDEDEKPEHDRDYGGVADWRDFLDEDPDRPAVMHLHGMVRRRRDPLRPVVLSESHFLFHGPKIREVVRERLLNSAVVFVGVSLSDPNLVGPLWDVNPKYLDDDTEQAPESRERHPCFVLHVPSAVLGAETIEEARSYVLKKYEYMEEALGVSPVFFKSYSQLYQALSELNLALTNDDYFTRTVPQPLRYGDRFSNHLRDAWTAVGASDAEFTRESFDHRLAVADRLAELLDPDSDLGAALLKPGSKILHRHDSIKRSSRDFGGDQEHFGIFVWLRTPTKDDSDVAAPYALNLAASSTYIHRNSWSFARDVPIEPTSKVPAARAVYSGLLTRANLPEQSRFPLWRGVWAIPLRVSSDGTLGGPDAVTVGAIALNTSHQVVVDAKSAQGRASVLAAIAEDQLATDRLRDALETSVAGILRATPR